MIQTGTAKDSSYDVEAIYSIAGNLLDLSSSADKKSVSWKMAEDFIQMLSTINLRFLLKV